MRNRKKHTHKENSPKSADITDLAGRHFISSSGNGAQITLLGGSGAHVNWDREPAASDLRDFRVWMALQLGVPAESLAFTEFFGAGREISPAERLAYQRFLERKTDKEDCEQ